MLCVPLWGQPGGPEREGEGEPSEGEGESGEGQ
jgi:hypothetical protein